MNDIPAQRVQPAEHHPTYYFPDGNVVVLVSPTA